MTDLIRLFSPDRIAVIGATPRPGSVGQAICSNLRDFTGSVVGVNPKYNTVLDFPCVDSIDQAGDVDLAIIAIPPENVVAAVEAVGQSGIRDVVVISAGFSEIGGGAERERNLITVAETYSMNVVGPNCLGVMNTRNGLNASFSPGTPNVGSISLFSQSGAFITAVLDWAERKGIGFKNIVSLGNKAVLNETDFIKAWDGDHETDVIVGYVESIESGREFIEVCRTVTANTPIILIKAGRTEAGARAASSHTGAIAGTDRAYTAGLKQAGIIRVATIEKLFDGAQALSACSSPQNNYVTIVSNAGGPGVMATDAIGASSLTMASLQGSVRSSLQTILPAAATVDNPVDILGDADADRFRTVLEIIGGNDSAGMIVVIACPTAMLDFGNLAEAVVDVKHRIESPLICCLMGGHSTDRAHSILNNAGIPSFTEPQSAVDALEMLVDYRKIANRTYTDPMRFDVEHNRANTIITAAERRSEHLLGVESMALLEAYGIPIPTGSVVDDPQSAFRVAKRIGGPVAMKIVSPDIPHKTDIGGVKVNVELAEVNDAYVDLIRRAQQYQPGARVLGVQVQQMVATDDGVETIVGMTRDPQFGPILMFGIGGVFVEILKDTTFRVAPVSKAEAKSMVGDIQSIPVLRGIRGRSSVDEDAIVETIGRVSQLVTDFPMIAELDINPLIALPNGVQAIDLRLTLEP